ncbi:MAG: hypothetical protein VX896_03135 [Candidatus Neomarinimicrobiota bacterium]|nr:hypothetical protein [Candidatus Neomarinimicrobiota bacterium]
MDTKQIAVYLIVAGAVILALKLFTEIIAFILSDFFVGLGSILMIGGAIFLALKFIKEDRDDAKNEPFRGIDE